MCRTGARCTSGRTATRSRAGTRFRRARRGHQRIRTACEDIMSEQLSRVEQRQVVNREVAELLGRSAAYSQLPAQEQAAILRNTQEVVDVMVSSKLRDAGARGRP